MTHVNPAPNDQHQIDLNLKRVYDETLKEDVPDRFRQLLAALRDRDKGEKKPT